MFERFTPAALQVLVRAQREARTFGHPWLGSEHLLLGVLAQPDAPGVSALTELGVTLDVGRAALNRWSAGMSRMPTRCAPSASTWTRCAGGRERASDQAHSITHHVQVDDAGSPGGGPDVSRKR